MNKQDFIRELSERLSISQRMSNEFLDCFYEITVERLRQNEPIKLAGLGRLFPRLQSSRPGRNPRTGVGCPIPERQSVRFKASKYLIEALNGNNTETKQWED